MKIAAHLRLICLLAGLGLSATHAKDAADYRLGDVVAGQDIISPIAFEVVDPIATVALKASESAKIPVVYRSYSEDTNQLVSRFNAAFDTARSNFLSSVQDTFQKTKLDDAAVATPDFGYLVTAFNIKYKDFPITTALAQDWAAGRTGHFTRNELVTALLVAGQCHLQPDALPDGFVLGDVAQLVTVSRPDQKLTLADMRGQIVARTDLITLSQARLRFRQVFKGYDEQPLARILAAWLQPNCLPDLEMTRLVRDHATSQLVVAQHYSAGQVIAPQGSVIDTRAKAALDELQQRLAAGATNKPGAYSQDAPGPSAALTVAAPSLPAATARIPAVEIPTESPAPAPNLSWYRQPAATLLPTLSLGLIDALGLLLVVYVAWKLIARHRNPVAAATTRVMNDLAVQLPAALQTQLAPQLVQAVRDALVQELAGQRHDLLVVQQNAAVQVTQLVRKMDAMQMELQERMQVYEAQIHRLESELAARTEENQELIKLKIEMLQHQRKSEAGHETESVSAGELVEFN